MPQTYQIKHFLTASTESVSEISDVSHNGHLYCYSLLMLMERKSKKYLLIFVLMLHCTYHKMKFNISPVLFISLVIRKKAARFCEGIRNYLTKRNNL